MTASGPQIRVSRPIAAAIAGQAGVPVTPAARSALACPVSWLSSIPAACSVMIPPPAGRLVTRSARYPPACPACAEFSTRRSRHPLIGGDGQEVDVVVGQRHLREQRHGLLVPGGVEGGAEL